ncbi:hypothetical protein B0H10DRAFT_1968745 [Mycena sp. CBHHK59/15]|nr:hypothetical protein B0H10DRAFT_1968745 [Mycena sp. CBHHK59/15]
MPPAAEASPVSSVTFVIHTQRPGPFTFNINLTGAAAAEHLTLAQTTPAGAPEQRQPRHAGPRGAHRPQRQQRREFLVRPTTTARDTTEVPETPQPGGSPLVRPAHACPQAFDGASQDVAAPSTPQSQLANCSDTEDTGATADIEAYHANEPTAVFSPDCQLVTPSRKRKLSRTGSESPVAVARRRKLEGVKMEHE